MALSLVVPLIAAACASGPQLTPTQSAFESARSVIDRSAEAAFEASDRFDTYVVWARHNPARCECPEFEVFVYGRWFRVYFDAPESILSQLRARVRRASVLETLRVEGKLTRVKQASERNVAYPIFALEAVR